ncbi:hypothetical protein DPMN_026403 [Dreissena polymorpha]|uniref:Uncharacterized protein n=1 Tax=Dreissena polymorpha TaxID=45954 RepID=A0A9D4REI9_DREPO|nr:hypothetical protein DPMN_026403 [Dreissena polymorpha]
MKCIKNITSRVRYQGLLSGQLPVRQCTRKAERARSYSTTYISTVSFQSWKKVGMECAYMP